MLVDAHHHFWHYDPIVYDWIDDRMQCIRTDFLPGKLEPILRASGIDGVVTVQARQTVEETDWLIGLARANRFIKGVVGWLPLQDARVEASLEKYRDEQLLKGLRHVVQGEPDPGFILGDAFNRGVALLKKYNMVYDILVVERQLPQTIRFVDRHPGQLFVLDHLAKPLIGRNELSPWKENILELAKRSNVSCKISGMVTEADYQTWTPRQLHPYFEVALEAFGPDRLLFGSDWPVCVVAVTYADWIALVREQLSVLSPTEQEKIMGANAAKLYKLNFE